VRISPAYIFERNGCHETFYIFLDNKILNREKKRESGKDIYSEVRTISFKLKKKEVHNKYHV
jgi:hypothetical protein